MNRPIVSVIIPVYNVEPYLRQCINSVLSQTYNRLEIILVDDGSQDNSPLICDEYAAIDNRIVVIHKANGGLSDARNKGLEICTGEYVFFVDSDDYLAPQCIEDLITASTTGALAITGYLLDLTDKGTITEAPQASAEYSSLKDYLKDFHRLFATKFNFAWGKLYSADIIRAHNLTFSKDISLVEDVLFNLNYYRYCKNGFIAIPLNGYYYRQHGNSTLSKKFNDKMFEWNELCYTKVHDFLNEFGCLTDINREHLYRNIVGNYQYGFHLIATNAAMSFSDKVSMIRKYAKTPILKGSLSISPNTRIDYSIFHYLLKYGLIRTYVLLDNIKRRFTHVLKS